MFKWREKKPRMFIRNGKTRLNVYLIIKCNQSNSSMGWSLKKRRKGLMQGILDTLWTRVKIAHLQYTHHYISDEINWLLLFLSSEMILSLFNYTIVSEDQCLKNKEPENFLVTVTDDIMEKAAYGLLSFHTSKHQRKTSKWHLHVRVMWTGLRLLALFWQFQNTFLQTFSELTICILKTLC